MSMAGQSGSLQRDHDEAPPWDPPIKLRRFCGINHEVNMKQHETTMYMGVEPKIGGFYPQNGW